MNVPAWFWHAAPAAFLVHAVAMLVDEAWFHRRRGLPRWERWGHPADTLTLIACLAIALAWAPAPWALWAYAAAAAFSTAFVTKDEWVHARACAGGEQWLHALLFALHPVLLFLVGLHGWRVPEPALAGGHAFFGAFLAGQAALAGLFLLWQTLYWNGPWAPPLPAVR